MKSEYFPTSQMFVNPIVLKQFKKEKQTLTLI